MKSGTLSLGQIISLAQHREKISGKFSVRALNNARNPERKSSDKILDEFASMHAKDRKQYLWTADRIAAILYCVLNEIARADISLSISQELDNE